MNREEIKEKYLIDSGILIFITYCLVFLINKITNFILGKIPLEIRMKYNTIIGI